MHSRGCGFDSRPLHHLKERVEMKLSKMWVFKQLFFYVVLLALVWCGYHIFKPAEIPPDIKSFIIMGRCIVGLLYIAFLYITVYDFWYGHLYVEKLKIPISEFDITEYENIIVVKYKKMAFSLNKYNKRFIEREWISATQYYDRNKKESGWLLNIPYMKQ